MRGPEYERTGSFAPTWYLYDGLGSVLGTINSSGVIQSTRKYDVYGAMRGSTGPSGTKHKYVGSLGHPSENETGLVYMRARYYDPFTGKFVSEDPARHGTNWYAYADNNPINKFDRTGKNPTPSQLYWAIVVAILALILIGLALAGPAAIGSALLGIISLLPGGLGLAIRIGCIAVGTARGFSIIGELFMGLIGVMIAIGSFLGLWDDTFNLNELFGSDEPVEPFWIEN